MPIYSFIIKSLLIVSAVTLLSGNLKAEELKFLTSYDTKYIFSDTAVAEVNQRVEIINKQKDIIPTSFTLIVKNIEISDVQATDAKEKLNIETSEGGNETIIKALFDEQQIGIDKKNEINISYKTKDLATKMGKIYSISIPPVNEFDSIEDYHITIQIPNTYGKKLFVSPTPIKEEVISSGTIYYFDKNSLESGVSAAFGEFQIYDFNIKYNLKNTSVITSYQTVALPPEINRYQQVIFKNIDPTPEYVKTDKDGNFIAHYKLAPKSEIYINVIGQIKVIPFQFDPNEGGNFSDLPQELVKQYTSSQKYWETGSQEVRNLAKSIKNPDLSVTENAKLIYKDISERLKYNSETQEETISRKGARATLQGANTLACMEFTDTFVAIARAMGIPAREINGYALPSTPSSTPVSSEISSGDFLHAWAEFYDPKLGWLQIDPTWGNTSGLDYFTKLDTNHIAFVTKGINSELPLPAGAYRFDDNEKQIDIKTNDNASDIEKLDSNSIKIEIKPTLGFNILKYLKGQTAYKIKNLTGRKIYAITEDKIEIGPLESKTIYTKKDSIVEFKDFSGETYTFDTK